MFALPISKPRFKSILFFNQNSPKMKLFLQKNAKFLSAGDSAPTPPIQPPPPHCEFLATRLSSTILGKKISKILEVPGVSRDINPPWT